MDAGDVATLLMEEGDDDAAAQVGILGMSIWPPLLRPADLTQQCRNEYPDLPSS